MKMRSVPKLALPAGQTIELKPGGYHVMLMDLKAPVATDQQVPLTLVFEAQGGLREQVELKASARTLNAGAMSGSMGQGHQHDHQH